VKPLQRPLLVVDFETCPDPASPWFGQPEWPGDDSGPSTASTPSDDWEAWQKTAVDPTRCRVVAWGFSLRPALQDRSGRPVGGDFGEVRSSVLTALPADRAGWDATERDLLVALQEAIAAEAQAQGMGRIANILTIAGHNVAGFDLPVWALRSIKYNLGARSWLPWPDPGEKPWIVGDRILDTMVAWAGTGRRWTSLPKILDFMGIPERADEGSGADVYRWACQGRFDHIEKHVRADIHECADLITRVWGART